MPTDLLLRRVRLLLPQDGLPAGARVALAMAGGIIQAVVPDDQADVLARGAAVVRDGGDGWLLPGIVDAHFHLLGYAATLTSVDCRPERARSIREIQTLLRDAAARTPAGEWVRAWGYSEVDLAERRHPTAAELDAAAPDHPVRLLHRTGHACVLNTRALALAGITAATPEPPGGVIERDLTTGEPNGVLFEMGSYLNARNVPPPLAPDELRQAVRQADRSLAALGVTTIHDATVGNGPADWDLFGQLQREGVLGTRVVMLPGAEQVADMVERGLGYGAGDHRLRVGPAKLVLDRSTGQLHPHPAVLQELVDVCALLGFPVAVHAVEVETVAAALTAIGRCPTPLPPGALHRIEHCSVAPPAVVARMRLLAVAVVTQPGFIFHGAHRYLEQVPANDLPWLYRLRGFLEAGIPLALSTDCPVVPPDPGVTLRSAVERRGHNGVVLGPGEALSFEEALIAMTRLPARLGGHHPAGELRPGAVADCVVLAKHPAAPEAGWRVRVTVRDGAVVYEA